MREFHRIKRPQDGATKRNFRGLTGPHRCRIISLPKIISQLGQDTSFIMFSHFYLNIDFVVFVKFLLFQSTLYLVLALEKGPKNSIHGDLFKTKNPKQKKTRAPAVFYVPYDAWIGLIFQNASKTLSYQNFYFIVVI